jgi:hypothetical protein
VLVQVQYAVVIEKGATSYGAYVPDCPAASPSGETRDEVVRLIRRPSSFTSRDFARIGYRFRLRRRPSSLLKWPHDLD